MNIHVHVKTQAKEQFLKETAPSVFIFHTKAAARDGKANAALIASIAKYFYVPQKNVTILLGKRTKQKIISIRTNL